MLKPAGQAVPEEPVRPQGGLHVPSVVDVRVPGFCRTQELTSSMIEEFVRLVLYLYLLRGYTLQNLNHFACLELLPTFCRRGNISQWTFYPFYLFWYFLSKQLVALS